MDVGCAGTGDVEVWVDGHLLAGIEDVKRKFGSNQDLLCATGTERKNT